MADDRWWRGFDTVILDELEPGNRVLDVGCGDGGLVERLAAGGLDAIGADPCAPAHPRLLRHRVEDVTGVGRFDAVCAVMSLHHAELENVLSAVAALLRPRGLLFAYEFDWEAYDERAAAWVGDHGRSEADDSPTAWRAEHADLHTAAVMRAALADVFALRVDIPRPYLARMLGRPELEDEEQALIDDGALPPIGRWYVAQAVGDEAAVPRIS